mmetsp:Transcript_7627/g.19988  ORF Transcript_7627/g.19988 Transcript_7627/m.19988 type:complete len:213 (-) Transcript_7627:109-747(-)
MESHTDKHATMPHPAPQLIHRTEKSQVLDGWISRPHMDLREVPCAVNARVSRPRRNTKHAPLSRLSVLQHRGWEPVRARQWKKRAVDGRGVRLVSAERQRGGAHRHVRHDVRAARKVWLRLSHRLPRADRETVLHEVRLPRRAVEKGGALQKCENERACSAQRRCSTARLAARQARCTPPKTKAVDTTWTAMTKGSCFYTRYVLLYVTVTYE